MPRYIQFFAGILYVGLGSCVSSPAGVQLMTDLKDWPQDKIVQHAAQKLGVDTTVYSKISVEFHQRPLISGLDDDGKPILPWAEVGISFTAPVVFIPKGKNIDSSAKVILDRKGEVTGSSWGISKNYFIPSIESKTAMKMIDAALASHPQLKQEFNKPINQLLNRFRFEIKEQPEGYIVNVYGSSKHTSDRQFAVNAKSGKITNVIDHIEPATD